VCGDWFQKRRPIPGILNDSRIFNILGQSRSYNHICIHYLYTYTHIYIHICIYIL
jgi:hypothetical protein